MILGNPDVISYRNISYKKKRVVMQHKKDPLSLENHFLEKNLGCFPFFLKKYPVCYGYFAKASLMKENESESGLSLGFIMGISIVGVKYTLFLYKKVSCASSSTRLS